MRDRFLKLLELALRTATRRWVCAGLGHVVAETFIRLEGRPGYRRGFACVRCRANGPGSWVPHIPVKMLVPPEAE